MNFLTPFLGMLLMFAIYIGFKLRDRKIKKQNDEAVDRWNARVQKEWDKRAGRTTCKHGNPIHERCDICEKL